jgi:transcriptional regulator with XRE-family HTH domain
MSRTTTPVARPSTIRKAIEIHGDTITEAAEKMGITRRALTYWLKGEREPTGLLQQRALNTYLYGAMQIEKKQKGDTA